MRRMTLILLMMLTRCLLGGQNEYDNFISKVSQSCENPCLLLTASFTNDVAIFRTTCTNIQGRCAADLALAIALMQRMDCDGSCVANEECFKCHQNLVSNIVYCSGLEDDSWIRYAAAVEYITGFNYGNQPNAAFVLCTNMIANIAIHPPNMGLTNYWNSMSNWMKSSHETIPTVFRLNAAIWLAEHDRQAEVVSLTNSLPASAVGIFLEELNGR